MAGLLNEIDLTVLDQPAAGQLGGPRAAIRRSLVAGSGHGYWSPIRDNTRY